MIMTQMMLKHEPGWTLECNGKKSYLRRDHAAVAEDDDDGLLLPRKKSQKVCFRCDVEVREYERDEPEDYHRLDSYYYNNYDHSEDVAAAAGGVETEDNNNGGSGGDVGSGSASPLAMCASCLAALCVTVILPWLLMSG